jgi:hypothetical protein
LPSWFFLGFFVFVLFLLGPFYIPCCFFVAVALRCVVLVLVLSRSLFFTVLLILFVCLFQGNKTSEGKTGDGLVSEAKIRNQDVPKQKMVKEREALPALPCLDSVMPCGAAREPTKVSPVPNIICTKQTRDGFAGWG